MGHLVRSFVLSQVLLLMVALPGRAVAAGDSPIFPPASVFILPSSEVGGPIKVEPSSNTFLPPKAVSDVDYTIASKDRAFQATDIGVGCFVATFRSFTDARQYSLQQRSHLPDGSRIGQINHPVIAGEWVAVDQHAVYAAVDADVVYRNLDIHLYVEVGTMNLSARQRNEAAQAVIAIFLDWEAKLLDRAEAFAAHPIIVTPPPTPVPLSPTQIQARNGDFLLLWQEVGKLTDTCRTYAKLLYLDVVTFLHDNSEATASDWQSAGYAADQVGEHCDILMYSSWEWYFPKSLHRYASIRQAIKDEDRATILYKDTVWPDRGPSPYFSYSNTLHRTSGPYLAADAAKGRRFLAAMDAALAQDQQAIGELQEIAQKWGVSLP